MSSFASKQHTFHISASFLFVVFICSIHIVYLYYVFLLMLSKFPFIALTILSILQRNFNMKCEAITRGAGRCHHLRLNNTKLYNYIFLPHIYLQYLSVASIYFVFFKFMQLIIHIVSLFGLLSSCSTPFFIVSINTQKNKSFGNIVAIYTKLYIKLYHVILRVIKSIFGSNTIYTWMKFYHHGNVSCQKCFDKRS